MSVTAYSTFRVLNTIRVQVTSDLSTPLYYHWYVDGEYVGRTASSERWFALGANQQVQVVVVDTNDPNFDPYASPPAGYPLRKRLWWVRADDDEVRKYKVEQQQDGGAWTTIATVWARQRIWLYSLRTPPLVDLSTYSWRIMPIDIYGNEGTASTEGPETVVRQPDAVRFTASYDGGADRVTIAEAA